MSNRKFPLFQIPLSSISLLLSISSFTVSLFEWKIVEINSSCSRKEEDNTKRSLRFDAVYLDSCSSYSRRSSTWSRGQALRQIAEDFQN